MENAKCVCKQGKFCKSCYSLSYYDINRDEILKSQKEKYKDIKIEKKTWRISRGHYTIEFE